MRAKAEECLAAHCSECDEDSADHSPALLAHELRLWSAEHVVMRTKVGAKTGAQPRAFVFNRMRSHRSLDRWVGHGGRPDQEVGALLVVSDAPRRPQCGPENRAGLPTPVCEIPGRRVILTATL